MGGAAVDDVRAADVLPEQAGMVFVLLRQHAELGLAAERDVRLAVLVEGFHQGHAAVELGGDDVHVLDLRAAEQQREADVPVGERAGTEDGDVADVRALAEQGC